MLGWEVRKSLDGVSSIFPPVGPWDGTQPVRLGGKHVYLLSYFTSPIFCLFVF